MTKQMQREVRHCVGLKEPNCRKRRENYIARPRVGQGETPQSECPGEALKVTPKIKCVGWKRAVIESNYRPRDDSPYAFAKAQHRSAEVSLRGALASVEPLGGK